MTVLSIVLAASHKPQAGAFLMVMFLAVAVYLMFRSNVR